MTEVVASFTTSTSMVGIVAFGQSVFPQIQEEVFRSTNEIDMMTKAVDFSSQTISLFGDTQTQVFSTMQQSIITTTQKVNELSDECNGQAGGEEGWSRRGHLP